MTVKRPGLPPSAAALLLGLATFLRSQSPPAVRPPFEGPAVVNLPTTTTLPKGDFLFRVSHRFYPSATEGWKSFFGLDGPAFTLLGLGYGLTDRLTVDLARASLDKALAFGLHWAAADQGSLPFSVALRAGAAWATEEIFGRKAGDSRNFKLHAQLTLARRVGDRVSLAVVPSVSTQADHWTEEPKGVFAVGLAGRVGLAAGLSFIGEWTPVLSGYRAASSGWAFGLEKAVGGHIFQLFVLNSAGLTADQYLPGGDLSLAEGKFRVGFTIYRLF